VMGDVMLLLVAMWLVVVVFALMLPVLESACAGWFSGLCGVADTDMPDEMRAARPSKMTERASRYAAVAASHARRHAAAASTLISVRAPTFMSFGPRPSDTSLWKKASLMPP